MAIKAAVIDEVDALSPDELKSFGGELGKKLQEVKSTEVMKSLADSMPPDAKKKAIADAAANLPDEAKKEIAKTLGGPSPETRDKLWAIAVRAFAIVMVGAFLFLAIGIFVEQPKNPVASGDILLSIFTAAVGFFAGLFAPSPGKG